MQIPPFTLNRQYHEIGSEIESEVSKVLKGGQYIGGQEITKFEEIFSNEGDGDFLLFYHGQLDDSRPGNNIPLTGEDLRSAVRDLNQDNSYPSNQMPSLGCNIKWTPGKEPSWFK